MAYISAVRRLNQALTAFDNSGMPMDPGPGRDPLPWTPEQYRAIVATAVAFHDVVERRREWDGLRREWHPAH